MNRENWLSQAVAELRPLFAAAGVPLPTSVRVTCGFPSTARRSGTVGETWTAADSADGATEIMISPVLALAHDVLAVLLRQLAVAAHPRKPEFALGAVGGDPALYAGLLADLGTYPHAALALPVKATQATRMLKASCPSCGYTVRLTQKWVNKGLPICGVDGESFIVEKGEEE